MQHPTKKAVSFFDLPNELRNEIYHLTLEQDNVIKIRWQHWPSGKHTFFEPALLRTSPVIHEQASPIYYWSNTFRAFSLQSARDFLQQRSRKELASLRNFQLDDRFLTGQGEVFNPYTLLRYTNSMAAAGRGALNPDALCVPITLHCSGKIHWFKLCEIKAFVIIEAEQGHWRVALHEASSRLLKGPETESGQAH